jgi:hypothetical protein
MMSCLTLLDQPSALIMEQLIYEALFKTTGPAATKALKALLKVPPQPSPAHVLVEHIWVESGNAQPSRSASIFADIDWSVISLVSISSLDCSHSLLEILLFITVEFSLVVDVAC